MLMIRTARRDWLRAAAAATLASAVPRRVRSAESAQVVVVGGGFGGATAAKYVRKESAGAVGVTPVERETALVSCPLSDLVVGGMRPIEDLTVRYDGLQRALLRSRLPDLRVDRSAQRACGRRRRAAGLAHAALRAHGQPAGEGVRRRGARAGDRRRGANDWADALG